MSDAGVATEPSARPAPRRDHTGRDMVLSLAVLLIPILVIGGVLRACGSSAPTVIDPGPAVDTARAAGLFPVVVPRGLSADWQPVQATFRRTEDGTRGTLRLGYLSPSGGQVLLLVSSEDTEDLLLGELGDDVQPQGEVRIGEKAWASSLVRGHERALVLTETVRTQGDQVVRTIIIVGLASLDDLTALAGSLG